MKKYFHALRPALAIRALRMHPDRRPPMNLYALIAASGLPAELIGQVEQLVQAKARTNELSKSARLPQLDAFIRSELPRATELPDNPIKSVYLPRANALFREAITP